MRLFFSAAVLLLSAAACSNSPQAPQSEPSALVALAPASTGEASETLTVYGDVSADLSAQSDIAAPVEAMLTEITAPLGAAVRAGDVVARLAPSPATKLNIAQAVSDANQADAALARAKRLRADGLVSDAEVETARAAATSSDAALASLRGRGLVLRSPTGGTVTSIAFAQGDLIGAGATVAVVTADGDVRARFGLDPALARLVSTGDPIEISPTSGGAAFTVQVAAIDPVVDPVTRLASIFAVIPAAAEIAPGEPLKGDVTVSRSTDALTVPYAALLDDGGQAYVYKVANGTARRADVVTGGRSGDRIAIRSGLSAGDMVVTTGAAGVSDGLAVRTEPSGTDTAPVPAVAGRSRPPGGQPQP